MKKVLIITFFYPPYGVPGCVGGAIRISKISKYLPEFDWEPIIITAKNTHEKILPFELRKGEVYETPYIDFNSFVKRLIFKRSTISITEKAYGEKSKFKKALLLKLQGMYVNIFNFPDEMIDWYRSALRKGVEILKEKKINLIFSCFGPPASHLVAYRLKKKTGLPWIADFRDPWTQSHLYHRPILLSWIERSLEKKVISGATLLTTVSSPLARELRKLHKKEVVVIPNGFDPEDYPEVNLKNKFTITYIGIVHKSQNLEPFFVALSSLLSKNYISPQEIDVRFYGRYHYVESQLINRFRLSEVVKKYERLTFRESIKKQKESHLLLLGVWSGPKGKGVYTTKIFEYLGAKRFILAVGEKNTVIANLLNETKAGVVENDPYKISNIILEKFNEFKTSGDVKCKSDERVINKYSRKELTRRLAEVFDNVTKYSK
jgi:glycosyltransferase involved in cell wall biosynthesis